MSTALRTERPRLQYVGAAPDAAVQQHLAPAIYCFDDLRKRLDRRGSTVKLAAAVVRDDDAVNTVVDSEASVFRGHDALKDYR